MIIRTFFLLLLYGSSCITLELVIISFNKGWVIIIFTLMTFIQPVIFLYVDTPVWVKWSASLLSPVAFELGLTEVCVLRPLINLYCIFGVQKHAKLLFFLLWVFSYLHHSYFRLIETVSTKDFCKVTFSNLVFNIQQI